MQELIEKNEIGVNHVVTMMQGESVVGNTMQRAIFVEKGSVRYIFENEEFVAKQGMVLMISDGLKYVERVENEETIRTELLISPDILSGQMRLFSQANHLFDFLHKNGQMLIKPEPPVFARMLTLLKFLEMDIRNNWPETQAMRTIMLCEMTIYLIRSIERGESLRQPDETMSRLRSYIVKNYAEDLSLDTLGRMFYLQPNTISHNFKKAFGINVVQFIKSTRVAAAIERIDEDLSISELAEQVGFENVNSFIRVFRQVTGDTPLQYRKKRRKV